MNKIEIDIRNRTNQTLTVFIDVIENSLSRKWLTALNHLVENNYHLEKNYCWFGFVEGDRTAELLCDKINHSIVAINASGVGYTINDHFTVDNTIAEDLGVNHDKMNCLHRYFEDLQGVSGAMSPYYLKADPTTRWHIRQLNLLCHEYESLILSMRKAVQAPDWRRPSQLMCWLNAPRYYLDQDDYELFGVETLNRPMGGVFVGVNKSVGKHHWEVFKDEGRDSRISELVTSSLISQTEGAGDFDIEWALDPGSYDFRKKELNEFKEWLVANNFDPNNKSLTIGHPQVAQVDLSKSFGTTDHAVIWKMLAEYMDVYKIRIGSSEATYNYRWDDEDFVQQQIKVISCNG